MCGFFNNVVVGVGICMMDMLLLVAVFCQNTMLRIRMAARKEIKALRLMGYVGAIRISRAQHSVADV